MNKGLAVLIAAVVVFVAGLVVLKYSNIGILIILLGIGGLLVGAMLLAYSTGSVRTNFFDSGRYGCSDQPSEKVDLPPISHQAAENQE